jgi:EmrB/QacA subfamily drug resistance transporter
MIANGSLNVALPALARDLDASASSLQWMVDAYGLVFAGLLFTAGTLGDRLGRKGALQGGLLLFVTAGVMAAFATSAGQVIVARAVMGAAAAFVMPSTLSILTNVFPPHERGRAISLWAGIAAGGAALGPVTTGFLLEHFWWGSVFLVNLPLVLLALVAGIRLVPASKDPVEHALDLPGALLSIAGVSTLVFAIIEGPTHGWASSSTLLAFAVAGALLLAFVVRERTTEHPMLDLGLFRDRRFSVASVGISLAFFAMFGSMFLVTQYLQLVLDYRPISAGLVMLPVSLMMMVLAPQSPKLVARFGPARVVGAGLTSTAVGLAALSLLGMNSPVAAVYVAFVPMVTGMSFAMSPLTTLIMSSVPLRNAGVGSAMNDTTRELGGALGVAVLGSLLTTRFTGALGPDLVGLDAGQQHLATTGLAGALEVAADLPGQAGEVLAGAARSAFIDGMGVAALVGAAVVLLAAVASRRLLPSEAPVHPGADVVAPEPALAD